MRKRRFAEEPIITILREHEAGPKTADVCRKYGISEATFYKYKAKFGGTEVGAVRILNGAIRETLHGFDDDAMAFSYSVDESPDVLASNMLTGYIGKARVAPVTATGQWFVEWSSDWAYHR